MKINKRLIALLAIFCIVASAGIVCAEQTGADASADDAGSADADTNVDDSGNDGDTNADTSNPDADVAQQELNATTNATDNVTANVTGNTTANTTANATSANATNSTSLPNMIKNFVTGNPILILAIVIIIGAGAFVYKRE